ncbi:histone deacetylase family protein [Candidatus Berkiella aquae]|uniref:Histone deacetylase family protein n=1 Tax=Candidatus Berkiella aquae TaxID=295108 RepID=A0A0Q9YZP2_9GAMM|nr:histone deacetylase family protein [Candidatus Berkiella aquae]MCS5712135.1 histone deacetylase family protein [Candidatus Berkiella aquae]
MTNSNTINIYTHSDCLKHKMEKNHPEAPTRLIACKQALQADLSLANQLRWKNAPKATKAQLARVHDKTYIDRTFALSPREGIIKKDIDAKMNPYTLSAALSAAGAQIAAVKDVINGKTKRAFCLVRPPGHHASQNKAAGFSFFNNVAVGAAHALNAFKLKRIAIIDFDVHHGDGTEKIFYKDPRVLFWSSFQHPHYPHGTKLDGHPSHINLAPLNANSGSNEFRKRVETQLIPSLIAFKPECIFISAGFDAHKDDKLSSINLNEEDYAFVTKEICKVADKFAKGRVISTLEGGYNVKALAASVKSHVKAMVPKFEHSLTPPILSQVKKVKTLIPSLLISTLAMATQLSRFALVAFPSTLLLNFCMVLFPLDLIRTCRNQFKTQQHENYCLKTEKDIKHLTQSQSEAFTIGRKAAQSYTAHLGSFFSWSAYRSPKAFYAGFAASEGQNKVLMSRIKKK